MLSSTSNLSINQQ
jgi:hypothetical protein